MDATESSAARVEQRWNERLLAAPLEAPRVRAWTYPEPAVVLGRAQRGLAGALATVPSALEAAPPAARAPSGADTDRDDGTLPIVERLAGGGAVLVGPWMIGLSVALPPAHPLVAGRSIAASYGWLADVFVAMLAHRGVAARAAGGADARKAEPELGWACFAGVTAGEVLVGGRKLVGFAQRRNRHGVLLVAGMLLDTVPWDALCATVLRDRPAPVRAAQAAVLAETTVDLRAARTTSRDRVRAPATVEAAPDAGRFAAQDAAQSIARELERAVLRCIGPSASSPACDAPVYA